MKNKKSTNRYTRIVALLLVILLTIGILGFDKAAVKAEVEKRIAGNAPRGNSTNTSGEITPEAFRKMSLTQQATLRASNPELYKRLTKR